jgi:cell division septation protein DedD
MLSLLKKHNIPANRVKTGSAGNTNAKPIIRNTSSNTNQSNSTVSPTKESHSPMKYSNVPSRPDKTPATPIRTYESTPTKPTPQGDGLYRFRVATQLSKGFSVQIGAFKEYGNVLREVARIQDDYSQPILVHIVRQGDVSIYKILIGDFENRQQAISYQSQLKAKGLEGVIKDLSTMK